MNIINVDFVQSDHIEEYKKLFIEEIVSKDLYFEGFKLFVLKEDFEHICFDSDIGSKYKQKFSYRRARRILFIPQLCGGVLPYRLIWQSERENPSVCVLIEELDFAIYLIPKKSENELFLRLGTIIAYGSRVERRIDKQLNCGREIRRINDIKEEVN